ncbi:hypothetical protein RHGRI_000923 [Rhododendron griersonianum]|uniref:Uncharacterized protein n=1 Tax=Rhododendron griersonianum TaxID=479676 RepID=A0AAV6LKL1_9ERIC|nr:hypothetical protein RHGRI_000923 [Rhododendron griersonianum]
MMAGECGGETNRGRRRSEKDQRWPEKPAKMVVGDQKKDRRWLTRVEEDWICVGRGRLMPTSAKKIWVRLVRRRNDPRRADKTRRRLRVVDEDWNKEIGQRVSAQMVGKGPSVPQNKVWVVKAGKDDVSVTIPSVSQGPNLVMPGVELPYPDAVFLALKYVATDDKQLSGGMKPGATKKPRNSKKK